MESAASSGRREPPLAGPDATPSSATLTPRKVSATDIPRSDTGTRSRAVSQYSARHLPSPTLTPNDPPPRPVTEPSLARERGISSPAANVPTPEPSSDSQSDGQNDGEPGPDPDPSVPPPAALTEANVSVAKTRSRSSTKTSKLDGVRRLSASKIQELTAAPESLPVAAVSDRRSLEPPLTAGIVEASHRLSMVAEQADFLRPGRRGYGALARATPNGRPAVTSRTLSTPPMGRRKSFTQPSAHQSSRRSSIHRVPRPPHLDPDATEKKQVSAAKQASLPARNDKSEPSPPPPIPPAIPLPPMSIPTLLQLELAGQRPSPLYIHNSQASDIPYESSAVKFERLKNFLLLPWFLERAITFGALACLDAWLWTFTVLPMRFWIAASVLVRWWTYVIGKEIRWLVGFVWYGLGRMWQRGRRGRSVLAANGHGSSPVEESKTHNGTPEAVGDGAGQFAGPATADAGTTSGQQGTPRVASAAAASKQPSTRPAGVSRHRRTKSSPSDLTSFHKADLLQGAIIICSSIALMNLDASRMYHFIRAQSAIKLYAIYNLLEVGDRLLSALGQDVFECLFSTETLSRNSSGRSKVMLPLGMFLLALVYNVLHCVVLFYQVIALNVAVNSYSNALLTLLLSNQFVEIKSAVFKRFEKENTFQLACADIVERFQLWIMLLIIGMRNVVEVGGLSVPGAGSEDSGPSSIPLHTASILPASFTIMPSWLWSGEVLSPFIVVIGSEMVVDWIKHAYINKFNNIKPNFYSRILDILCKDYYTNAFVTPSLTRRLGLPLLPLSCLFIRASVQIYHMFLATHLPTPLPPSTQTSLSVESATPSPAMLATLDRIDHLIRNALGRAVYGYPYAAGDPSDAAATADSVAGAGAGAAASASRLWARLPFTSDDAIAAVTMVVVFLLVFLVLLLVKLVLGLVLLRYARDRYARMKVKEHAVAAGLAERESYDARGKRTGGYGQVEVGEERRRWIFGDDVEGLRKAREKERRAEANAERDKEKDWGNVVRYEMVARRIW